MTILEAINKIDATKPNSYGQPDKIRWLSVLDGIIKREIIDTHEGAEGVTFDGYTENTDLTKELLVPAPYDDIYLRYLELQIDYANNEFGKYNNSMQMYRAAYNAYANFYNRTHMPIGKKFKF
jgi:hypothetical protein